MCYIIKFVSTFDLSCNFFKLKLMIALQNKVKLYIYQWTVVTSEKSPSGNFSIHKRDEVSSSNVRNISVMSRKSNYCSLVYA